MTCDDGQALTDQPRSMSDSQTGSKDGERGLGGQIIRAGAIAAAISAVVSLAVLVYKRTLAPVPAPAALVAHVKDVSARAGVTQYDWLAYHPAALAREQKKLKVEAIKKGEPPLSTQEVHEALEHATGVEVNWSIFLEGPAEREFRETHTLAREAAGDKAPIAEGPSSYWPPEAVTSRASKYENRESAFIQEPARAGTYSIEIYLKSADGDQQEEGSAKFSVPGP
jgi:hypothetical protein